MCIYSACIHGLRYTERQSWCADIHKDPKYKHPEIQHSKNPKLFASTESCIFFGFLVFWICGLLDFWIFWIFCALHLFSICRNSSKIGFGIHGGCIVYSFLRGVRVVGGVTIYIYICIYVYNCITLFICLHSECERVCVCACVYESTYINVKVHMYIYIPSKSLTFFFVG